jgi:hypothetical protein
MSNGIGTIDCAYCEHFRTGHCKRLLIIKEHIHKCSLHNIRLPKLDSHLICNKFKPDKDFKDHVAHMVKAPNKHYPYKTAEEAINKQMKQLEKLEPNTLYTFQHKNPTNLTKYKKIEK